MASFFYFVGNTGVLNLKSLLPSKRECTSLLSNLIMSKNASCKHLEFLVKTTQAKGSGYVKELACDLSEINCAELLLKPDITLATLKAFFQLGVSVNLNLLDIHNAISSNKKLGVGIVELVLSKCSPPLKPEELTQLCFLAVASRKPDIAAYLVRMNKSVVDLAELLLVPKCTPDVVEMLLNAGIDPNGCRGENPLDIVLKSTKFTTADREHLIYILIEKGASLEQASYPRTLGTTIVHKTTEMALETG